MNRMKPYITSVFYSCSHFTLDTPFDLFIFPSIDAKNDTFVVNVVLWLKYIISWLEE